MDLLATASAIIVTASAWMIGHAIIARVPDERDAASKHFGRITAINPTIPFAVTLWALTTPLIALIATAIILGILIARPTRFGGSVLIGVTAGTATLLPRTAWPSTFALTIAAAIIGGMTLRTEKDATSATVVHILAGILAAIALTTL